MGLSQFLLLVTLTCIACNNIVASSEGLIQIKTLDANSHRELTDGTRRKLREGVENDDTTGEGEERVVGTGGGGFKGETVAGYVSIGLSEADYRIIGKASEPKEVKDISVLEKLKRLLSADFNKLKAFFKRIISIFQHQKVHPQTSNQPAINPRINRAGIPQSSYTPKKEEEKPKITETSTTNVAADTGKPTNLDTAVVHPKSTTRKNDPAKGLYYNHDFATGADIP